MDPSDPHIEILLRFGEAMGLDPEAVKQSKPLPTTQALLDWYFILTRHRSMVEVVSGAQIGIESQPPQLFGALAQPLREKYGCTEEQIAFFPTHVEADTEHGGRAYDLVEKYARTPSSGRAPSWPPARAPRSAGCTSTASTSTTAWLQADRRAVARVPGGVRPQPVLRRGILAVHAARRRGRRRPWRRERLADGRSRS